MSDTPDPAAASHNPAMWNGILPGVGWPSDLLHTEDDDGFFTDHIVDLSTHEGTQWVVDQAHAQWRQLFPSTCASERLMFMAGVVSMCHWMMRMSVKTRNEYGDDPRWNGTVHLDEVDEYVAMNTRRLCSLVFALDEDIDLSAWEDDE